MKCRQNVDELHPQTRNEKKEEDIEMNWGLFHNPYNNVRVLKDNSEHINILLKLSNILLETYKHIHTFLTCG